MAQKIKLGARPKSFARLITFALVEGGDGCIEVQFKYRTRTEMAVLIDDIQASGKGKAEADMAVFKEKIEKGEIVSALTQVDLLDRDLAAQVDYLMQVLDGWNLDEEFSRSAVEQLADEVPAAISAILEGYRKAIHEGRLGN